MRWQLPARIAVRGLLGLATVLVVPPMPRARGDAPVPVALPKAQGLKGQQVALDPPKGGVSVVVFYSSECPISNAYSPTLNQLAGEFPPSTMRLVGLCVDFDLSDEDISTHAKDFGLKFPVARDQRGAIAAKLGAKVTPEAFVLDSTGRLRYRGRIDDQFAGRGKRNANSTARDLRDAVAAVLAGREVAREHVEAVGCPIPDPPKEKAKTVPTYFKDVAPILQRNCQECHRKGQVGPFALETFEQARKRADDVAGVVEDRRMPPWKPTPGVGPKFKHDRSLSPAEIVTLTAWAEGGTPKGDPSAAPPATTFPEGWKLGTPDLVIEPSESFSIPATGDDIYRCYVIPTDLPEDVYISAIEYQPGNRQVVHHILSYMDTSREGRKRDAEDPGLGYSCFSGPGVEVHGDLGGWAPGNEPSRLPEGIGRSLPREADVIMQVHYHPDGKSQTDRSRVGLHFSRSPIKQTLHWAFAANPGLELPPGQADIVIKAKWTVPVDLEARAVTPHMHMLGREMSMSITYPDGRTRDLVKIDDWDFGWQNTYYFEEPIDLPKGSVVHVVAQYDNTELNPRNPNTPPKLVKWGEATTDEMCIGFIAVTKKGQDLTQPGVKDDLHDIFLDQERALRKKYEKEGGKRRKRDDQRQAG